MIEIQLHFSLGKNKWLQVAPGSRLSWEVYSSSNKAKRLRHHAVQTDMTTRIGDTL